MGGDAPAPPRLLSEARAGLAAAQHKLDSAVAAGEALERTLEGARRDVDWAAADLRSRVKDVIRADPGVAKFAAGHVAAHQRLVRERQALQFLAAADMLPPEHEHAAAERGEWNNLRGDEPWRAAVAALEADADAPLPLPT
jgi:hypothetical protein